MGHDETEARQPYRNIAVKFYEGDYRYMLEMELTASGSWSQGSTWLVGIFDKQKVEHIVLDITLQDAVRWMLLGKMLEAHLAEQEATDLEAQVTA